ncbi:MAG: hypothetical protein ABI216_21960 [Devosia sp.]
MSEKKTGLERLREPFAANQIGKLPKPYKKDSPKGKCSECGGFHGLPAAHLDYVGHAPLTDRLLEVDLNWAWEPLSIGPDGLPVLDEWGGLWIRLTVCGVTRLGYGDAGSKTGCDAMKERIGDALRNAGMRFGAALDLWSKGDLQPQREEEAVSDLLADSDFKGFEARIRAEITKAGAKAVWQEAARACAAIGDPSSANLLKVVLMDHATLIDSRNKETAVA